MHSNKQSFRCAAVMAGALLLGACAMPPQVSPEELQARQAHLAKVQKAKARFEELCKTAGITVNRRVTGVKGIRLEKVPAESGWKDWMDPMWPEAALSGGADGGALLELLLKNRSIEPETGKLTGNVKVRNENSVPGFEYLDVRQPDGTWRRYSIGLLEGGRVSVNSRPIGESALAPYLLSYELLVDRSARELWIAGAEIKVTDVDGGGTLGVVRKYVWDRGMGDAAGGRSPWIMASGNAICPNLDGHAAWGHFLVSIEKIISPED